MVTCTPLYTIQVYNGLMTDEKPVDNVPNGSRFIEMDSGSVFMFNAATSEWLQYESVLW